MALFDSTNWSFTNYLQATIIALYYIHNVTVVLFTKQLPHGVIMILANLAMIKNAGDYDAHFLLETFV